jgi:hypothetical protein
MIKWVTIILSIVGVFNLNFELSSLLNEKNSIIKFNSKYFITLPENLDIEIINYLIKNDIMIEELDIQNYSAKVNKYEKINNSYFNNLEVI